MILDIPVNETAHDGKGAFVESNALHNSRIPNTFKVDSVDDEEVFGGLLRVRKVSPPLSLQTCLHRCITSRACSKCLHRADSPRRNPQDAKYPSWDETISQVCASCASGRSESDCHISTLSRSVATSALVYSCDSQDRSTLVLAFSHPSVVSCVAIGRATWYSRSPLHCRRQDKRLSSHPRSNLDPS